MRGGHNSRGPEQRLDALSERLILVELIQQDQLIEQYRAQHDQLRPFQAFDRHLTIPLEYVLGLAVDGFHRLMTQQMEDTTDVDTRIGVWVRAMARSHQLSRTTQNLFGAVCWLIWNRECCLCLERIGNSPSMASST